MSRRLYGIVNIHGVDDEVFKNETADSTQNVQLDLDFSQPAQPITLSPLRWGGECRVEVDLTATLSEDTNIKMDYEARLYEGISEDSDDMADRKPGSFIVLASGKEDTATKTARYSTELVNHEIGGGDYAKVSFTFTNVDPDAPSGLTSDGGRAGRQYEHPLSQR